MIDLYLSNKDFKGYVDRYCRKHHVTIEEALQHEIVKYVAQYYIKGVISMSFKKCEMLLKNYNSFKMGLELGNDKETKRLFSRLDNAIEFLKDEEFIGIITMHYFDRLTMERVAEIYDISLVTAYAQKKKMIKKIANIVLSDDVIKEILSL